MGSRLPDAYGQFLGERTCLGMPNDMTLCAKTAELIEMPFVLWTLAGPRKHVLGEVHTDATWQTPLNRPCAAAMRPILKLL